MKNIPLALRQAKNAFGQDSPWLMLLTLTLPSPDNTVFRIVPNTEDIVFQSQTFTAFPVQIELPKETNSGEIPSISLQVSNVTRVLQGHLETLNGGLGATVELIIVNTAHLTENYAELTMEFEVLQATCTAQWVTLKCGASNPLRRRFPADKYFAGHCNWQFNSAAVVASGSNVGAECAYAGPYTGDLATCKRTLADCEAHSNAPRFGGFPGLESGGLRFA
jgi:phage-related protein